MKGPELLSKWVGESEKAVREVFHKARQTSPTIVFFDEVDALAPKRGMGGDNNVTERVVNQLLTEMDGLVELNDVVVIAATNRPDMVDPALLRPGRFDRMLYSPIPDRDARELIFKVHTKTMPLASEVDLNSLADQTEGYVGADIQGICREAAIFALRKNKDAVAVTMADFENALKKVSPSVTKEMEEAYLGMEQKLKSTQAKALRLEKPVYVG